ncbi:hypothetical protein GCM10010264_58570 [Streptomyces globisporus]|nr:hypothetical protein GCM10010264_58570 [Streptomyces globisporus]
MADADDVVDAVRPGRDGHRATAALSGGGDGTVDRGRGVGRAVGAGSVVAYDVDDEAAPATAREAGSRAVAGAADEGDLGVGEGGGGELPPQGGVPDRAGLQGWGR